MRSHRWLYAFAAVTLIQHLGLALTFVGAPDSAWWAAPYRTLFGAIPRVGWAGVCGLVVALLVAGFGRPWLARMGFGLAFFVWAAAALSFCVAWWAGDAAAGMVAVALSGFAGVLLLCSALPAHRGAA